MEAVVLAEIFTEASSELLPALAASTGLAAPRLVTRSYSRAEAREISNGQLLSASSRASDSEDMS